MGPCQGVTFGGALPGGHLRWGPALQRVTLDALRYLKPSCRCSLAAAAGTAAAGTAAAETAAEEQAPPPRVGRAGHAVCVQPLAKQRICCAPAAGCS